MSGILLGLIGGGVSGLATTIGSVPILFKNSKIGNFLQKVNMDFIIGLMLSAAAFTLILPAFENVYHLNSDNFLGVEILKVTVCLFLGVAFIQGVGKFIEKILPATDDLNQKKKAILFIVAMMVHNFPEGLASGAAIAIPGSESYSLLGAIALQNIPEGFTTALSFFGLGLSPLFAFFGSFLTGVVELVGGMIGGYLTSSIEGVLPFLMAFAGGAMMNVVIVELIERLKFEKSLIFLRPSFLTGVAVVIVFNKI